MLDTSLWQFDVDFFVYIDPDEHLLDVEMSTFYVF